MKRNVVFNWLENINRRVCLYLNRKYYRQLDKGSLVHFIFNPLVYCALIARTLSVFFLIVLLKKTNFSYLSYRPENSIFEKFKGRIAWLVGLRKFVLPSYCPSYYSNALSGKSWGFVQPQNPKVSLVIPVYNQVEYTLTCLRSIYLNVSANISFEVLVLNDSSTDDTVAQISQIEGVKIVNNPSNLGFLRSCNYGIAKAKGEYIFLLNNDIILQKGALETLLDAMEADDSIGLIGSKLIYPNGLLQEAGGIIYQDASGYNYGNYRDPNHFEYNFVREVDYCTGASILFKKADFDQLGGFDEQYIPAYYEETDFCFSLRYRLNKKVIYQPLSEVVHFEGVSNGKKPQKNSIKQHEIVNRQKFLNKWQVELEKFHFQTGLAAARRFLPSKKMVVLDEFLPRYDKDSGSHRLFQLIKLFKRLNYQIVFIPKSRQLEQPYFDVLRNLGIEVIFDYLGAIPFKKAVLEASRTANVVWACRPKVNKAFSYIKKKYPNIHWIYDTVDLHFVRLAREADLNNSWKQRQRAMKYKRLELQIARWANTTISITDTEKQLLNEEGIQNTRVVPNIHETAIQVNSKEFEERKDLLFVGSYDHSPNVDAAIWLCKEIMPLIWEKDPQIKIHLVGTNPRPSVLEMANDRVIVHGFVENLDDIFNDTRVFVAPLRFGAGMKGKIGQAMSYGLPTVTTQIGAEGMGLVSGTHVVIVDEKQAFADEVHSLYNDKEKWMILNMNSLAKMNVYSPEEIIKTLQEIL